MNGWMWWTAAAHIPSHGGCCCYKCTKRPFVTAAEPCASDYRCSAWCIILSMLLLAPCAQGRQCTVHCMIDAVATNAQSAQSRQCALHHLIDAVARIECSVQFPMNTECASCCFEMERPCINSLQQRAVHVHVHDGTSKVRFCSCLSKYPLCIKPNQRESCIQSKSTCVPKEWAETK